MANHPEIQTRMQREIDEKIGEAEPRLKDKEEMPYTNAVCFNVPDEPEATNCPQLLCYWLMPRGRGKF